VGGSSGGRPGLSPVFFFRSCAGDAPACAGARGCASSLGAPNPRSPGRSGSRRPSDAFASWPLRQGYPAWSLRTRRAPRPPRAPGGRTPPRRPRSAPAGEAATANHRPRDIARESPTRE
jgi:hypothetical protein